MPSRPDFVADVAFAAGDGAAFVVEMNAYGALLQGTLFDWEADQVRPRCWGGWANAGKGRIVQWAD